MKATLVIGAILLSALTAVAQTAPPPQAAQPAQTTTPPENAPPDPAVKPQQPNAQQAPVVEADNPKDSPLVRAAKRSGRFKKKSSVLITNDTLVKDGGHFTTTKSQDALPDSGGAAPQPAAGTDAAAASPMSPTDKAYEERTKAAKEAKTKREAADLAAERAIDPAGQAAQQIPKPKVAPTLPGAPSTAPTPQMAPPPTMAPAPPPPQPPY